MRKSILALAFLIGGCKAAPNSVVTPKATTPATPINQMLNDTAGTPSENTSPYYFMQGGDHSRVVVSVADAVDSNEITVVHDYGSIENYIVVNADWNFIQLSEEEAKKLAPLQVVRNPQR